MSKIMEINDIKTLTDAELGKRLAGLLGYRLFEASEFTENPLEIMFETPDAVRCDFTESICRDLTIVGEFEQAVIKIVGGAVLTIALMEAAAGTAAFTTAKDHEYVRGEAVYLMSFANARLRAEACLSSLKPRFEDRAAVDTIPARVQNAATSIEVKE